MASEYITIRKQEYKKLKQKAEIDEELLNNLVQGLKAIQEGRVRRVR